MAGGALDVEETVVAANGHLFVADVGTALPTSPDVDDLSAIAAWYDVGYFSEDGVTLTVEPEIQEYRVWQSRQAIRREVVNQQQRIAGAMVQWNAETIRLSFGGGQVTNLGGGIFRYDFLAGDEALDERAAALFWNDGPDKEYVATFSRTSIMEAVEVQLQRGALAQMPITLSVLAPDGGGAPGFIYSNDPDFGS